MWTAGLKAPELRTLGRSNFRKRAVIVTGLVRVVMLRMLVRVRICALRTYDRAIGFRREFRKFVQKRNDRPDAVIVVGRTPGGHAGHFQPMLDDPERLLGTEI